MIATDRPNQVTQLLVDWKLGDANALDQLIPLVYQELRKVAAGYLRSERLNHTLQPTALLHEAYIRMVDQEMPEWQNRAHFPGSGCPPDATNPGRSRAHSQKLETWGRIKKDFTL